MTAASPMPGILDNIPGYNPTPQPPSPTVDPAATKPTGNMDGLMSSTTGAVKSAVDGVRDVVGSVVGGVGRVVGGVSSVLGSAGEFVSPNRSPAQAAAPAPASA